MINLNTRFDWEIKLGEINIIDDGYSYLLQVGYAYGHSDTPYLRVWRNDNSADIDFIGGWWLDRIRDKDTKRLMIISSTLIEEIIKQASRIEKLKAFV
jgi:hypothetical protein